eukprot:IDg951t1
MGLTDVQKGIIIARVEDGWGARRIALQYGWAKSTVQDIITRYRQTGNVQSRASNSGRKRITDERTDRLIVRSCIGSPEKRRVTSGQISRNLTATGIQISSSTVRRRLLENGLEGRVATKNPLLSPTNIEKRLKWAQTRATWTYAEWSQVLWSDESPFRIFGETGSTYVRRRANEKLHKDCVSQTVKHGGGKIMVWGSFSSTGTAPLVRITGIMDQKVYKNILVHHAKPALNRLNADIFQQDNDPKHTAKSNVNYLKSSLFPAELMEWPPQSPDLNPIENLW